MNCTVTYWTLSLVYGFTGCPVAPMTILDPHWVGQSGVAVIICLSCPYREEPELEPVEPELEDKVSEGEAPEEAELKAAEAAAEAAESSRKEEEVRDWHELPAGIVVSLPWHFISKVSSSLK